MTGWTLESSIATPSVTSPLTPRLGEPSSRAQHPNQLQRCGFYVLIETALHSVCTTLITETFWDAVPDVERSTAKVLTAVTDSRRVSCKTRPVKIVTKVPLADHAELGDDTADEPREAGFIAPEAPSPG